MNNVASITDKKVDLAAMVAEDRRVRAERILATVNEAMKADRGSIQLFVHIGEHKFPYEVVIAALSRLEISIEAQ